MKRKFSALLVLLALASCTKDKKENIETGSGYPKEVEAILINKCSTAGCHNKESYEGASGLDFSTWDNMFKGGFNGSSVIPYSTDYSYLLYFVNTDSTKGLSLVPQMPYNASNPFRAKNPVTTAEYDILKNWIANGAPDHHGFVKFSDDPNRKKFYVNMQGCDQVAVFDAETRVIMRYVSVGVDAAIESPHQVRITPDGKYWCVAFYSGHVLQIFNTSDDKLVRSVEIGPGSWNTIAFTPDSKTAYVASTLPPNEFIAPVNLATFTAGSKIIGISAPHGQYITKDSMLYVTSQTGNIINKINLKDGSSDPVEIKKTSPNANPHEIAFTPDESIYFVSCQNTNEVRVFNTSTDTLVTILPVGTYPQEFSLSLTHPYIFITCTEDVIDPFSKGSVYVYNYKTLQFVKKIYPGYQPHGIAVDDDHDIVYVANLNSDPNGPPPHHASSCSGRNGWISIIDIHTLDLLQVPYPSGNAHVYKNEVLPFPYYVAYRK